MRLLSFLRKKPEPIDYRAEVRDYLIYRGWKVPELNVFKRNLLIWRMYRESQGIYDMTILHPDFKKGAIEWGLGTPPDKRDA